MNELEIRTHAPGGSPLARALLAGEAPPQWTARCPASPDSWRARADAVRASFAAPTWSERLNPALAPAGAAAARLERVVASGGVVVTTGQQPGLFGGPLYTWLKALSALALADALERTTGIAVLPVFWAATDDADFDEAAWTAVALEDGVEELRLARPATAGIPMSDVPLGDVSGLIDRLERACGSASFAPALDAVRGSYQPGETIGGAYLKLLRAVLQPLGIPVLDASHIATRQAMLPHLRTALERAESAASAARARAEEMESAGFEPQVVERPDLSLVFAHGRQGRYRVTLADAERVARETAEPVLSPNVLLRPVMERAVLPTVAYVAGPGELAYFAQSSAVAEGLGFAPPLAVPRWSGTIIEPRVSRILERHGITFEQLGDPHAAEALLARAALPPEIPIAIERLRREVNFAADSLRGIGDGAESPLVPDGVPEGARRAMQHRIDRLERRFLAGVKRRESEVMRDILAARGALFPRGRRQERVLNFIPMLSRYGVPLLELLREAAGRHASALITTGQPAAARTHPDV